MGDALMDRMVQSPRLGLYLDRLGLMFAEERQRRERFYDEMDESIKQEFINGEVIVHSPVKREHTNVVRSLLKLLDTYVSGKALGWIGFEKTLISLTRNDYEPDICFFGVEKASRIKPHQMQFPAPDLVIEVLSPSTEANDRGVKFDDYAAHGVREYWIIDPDAEVVEQYILANDAYELRLKMNSGLLRSEVVAGFEIPVRAIFDERENLAVLKRIIDQVS